jgi:hypothetical protein
MRMARWLLILFQFCWLNIVLPGHTRGAIPMAGQSGAHSCCTPKTSSPADRHGEPTPADRARCALCYFAACMVTAPPVIALPNDAGAVGKAVLPSLHTSESPDQCLPYHGRAPPAPSSHPIV